MPSIFDFERQVFEREGVRVIVRSDDMSIELPSYDYQRQASGGTRLSDFLDNRICPALTSEGLSCSIISGDGNSSVHGNTKLETLRDSYQK
jgi:hypothetical protein